MLLPAGARQKSAYWQIFSQRLGAVLKDRGIRQNAFCDDLGVRPQTVNDWMKGRKTPSADRLFEIADLLGMSLDELIGRTPPRRRRTPETAPRKRKSKKKSRGRGSP